MPKSASKAEVLVAKASKKVDGILAIKFMADEEVRSLKAKLKAMEAKVAQAWGQVEAQLTEGLQAMVSQWEKELESKKAAAVEAFHSSKEFTIIKLEFASESHMQGLADHKMKVRCLFLDLDFSLLDIDEEDDKDGDEAKGADEGASALQPPLVVKASEPEAPTEERGAPTKA
ncbi:hypothetical protein COCNU_10G008370 [Cocos nucifera]|uniref:Uncharacterized protein n=1 Tax=Cocos nucifera TaxID=13894 RepID=A0A8K0N8I5_COCNU|nr:hypothetical protein COCNU_10G008370 [Cocos nucifera]